MGRYLFAIAAISLGIAAIALRAQLVSAWTLPGGAVFLWLTSVAQIVGGLAMLSPRWTRAAALTIAATYVICAATFLPAIVSAPGEYYSWGNVFYPLGVVAGALGVAQYVPRRAVLLFGVCTISYAIEQIEFFARTNTLVPSWMPLGAGFWNIVTAIGFAAVGIAFVVNRRALLAARLLTTMFAIFVVTIWLPALISEPSNIGNWSEGLETSLLAGSSWVIADYLRVDETT